MRSILQVVICVCLVAITCGTCALLWATTTVVATLPNQLAATRVALLTHMSDLQIAVMAEIDWSANGIRKDLAGQLNAIRRETLTEVAGTRRMLDRQLTGTRKDLQKSVAESLATTQKTVETSLATVVAPIEGIRADLRPVLTNVAALAQNANDSWDDSYDDVRGLIQSSVVAATQVAQTMQTVNEVAPQFLSTSQESNRQISGITSDVHVVTSRFIAPLSLKQKIWNVFKGVALIGSRI